MDRIFLRDLEVETIIGIYDWERTTPQKITLDLDMATDARAAAETDGIDRALNYKPIAKRLLAHVGGSRFQLIETLAESVATIVRDEFGATWVRVTVNKLGAVRHARNVGVSIERGWRSGADAVDVFVAAGSNIDPETNLKRALAMLTARYGGIARSTVYRNRAVGFDGDEFLNLVVGFSTRESPASVVAALGQIENDCGRLPASPRFGPRTLDLDLLVYGDRVVDADGIRTPRPELLKLPFMLRPLAELAGHRRHPENGRFFADLWQHWDGEPHAMHAVDLDQARGG